MICRGDVTNFINANKTDASRAQSLELHIQNRVNQELERIRSREAQTLADIEKKLEASSPAPSPSSPPTAAASDKPVASPSSPRLSLPPLSLESPRFPVAGPGNFRELEGSTGASAGLSASLPDNAASTPSATTTPYQSLSNASLSSEISAFKERLARRPALRELDPAVDRSRDFLVTCLRDHPRRPLNCAQEVEDFRNEIRRLESKWVDKVIA